MALKRQMHVAGARKREVQVVIRASFRRLLARPGLGRLIGQRTKCQLLQKQN
jgi:hypothetical protein